MKISLSIKNFIIVTFSVVILLSVAISIYVLNSLNLIKKDVEVIVGNNVTLLKEVSDLRHYTLSYRRFALDYGLTEDKKEHSVIKPIIEDNRERTLNVLTDFEETVTKPEDKAFIATFRQNFSDYVKTQEHYIQLIDDGKIAEARRTILGPMLAPFNAMIKPVEAFQADMRNDTNMMRISGDKHLNNITISMLSISAFMVIFISIAGFLLSRKINSPLAVLNQQMQRVGRGDLSQCIDMSRFTKDELGCSAKFFSEMQNSVASLIKDISKNVVSLDTTSSKLSKQSAEATQGIQNQQTDISQISTAMTDMLEGLKDIAANTNSTAEVAVNASEEANNGKQIVSKAVLEIETVSESLEKASDVINALGEDSANISSVTEVISSIAEQTNLLALNAAIEAARAGDQGRGFAVVADEVRTLAQRTQNSIDEITTTISSLQARAEEAVASMEHSRTGMSNSVDQAKLAGESIAELSRSVMSISETAKEVAAATDGQTSVTMELSDRIMQVNDASTKVSDVTLEAQVLYRELTSLSEDINKLTNRFCV